MTPRPPAFDRISIVLRRVRRRLRARIGVGAGGWLLAGLGLTLLLVLLAMGAGFDGRAARITALALLSGVALAVLVRRFLLPFGRYGSDDAVADHVEENLGDLHDGLLASVQFAREWPAPGRGDPQMAEALATRIARRLETTDLRPVVPWSAVRPAWFAVLAVGAAWGIAGLTADEVIARGAQALFPPPADGQARETGPLVGDLELKLHYPAYTGRAPRLIPNSTGDIEAPKGTRIEVRATTLSPATEARLRLGEADLPLTLTDNRDVRGEFVVDQPTTWRFSMTTIDGTRLIESTERALRVEQDQPPTVTLSLPAEDLELEDLRAVPVAFDARDDFGLSKAAVVVALAVDEEHGERIVQPGATGKRMDGRDEIDLSVVEAQAGDRLVLFVEVFDNNDVDGPQRGVSATRFITVRSPQAAHEALTRQLRETIEVLLDALADRLEIDWKATETPLPVRIADLMMGSREGAAALSAVVDGMVDDPLTPDEVRLALAGILGALEKAIDEEKKVVEPLTAALNSVGTVDAAVAQTALAVSPTSAARQMERIQKTARRVEKRKKKAVRVEETRKAEIESALEERAERPTNLRESEREKVKEEAQMVMDMEAMREPARLDPADPRGPAALPDPNARVVPPPTPPARPAPTIGPEAAAAMRVASRLNEGVVDELEPAIILVEAMVARLALEDMAALADEIKAAQSRLRDLVEQYRQNPNDEALKARIMRDIRRLQERMARMQARMAELRQKLPEEFLNLDGLKQDEVAEGLDQTRDQLSELQKMLEEGRIDEALAALDQMDQMLDQLSASLDQDMQDLHAESNPAMQQAISELMDQTRDLMKRQEALSEETQKLADAEAEARQEAVEEGSGERLEQIKKEAEALERTVERMARQDMPSIAEEDFEHLRQRTDELQRALDGQQLMEALEMGERSMDHLDNMDRFGRYDPEGQRMQDLVEQGRRQSGKVIRDLAELIDEARRRTDQAVSPDQARELRQQQQALSEAADRLRRRISDQSQQVPGLGEQPQRMAEQVGDAMRGAAEQLRQRRPAQARPGQQQAQSQLQSLMEGLRQAAQPQRAQRQQGEQQGRQQSRERVRIPGADDYEAPAEFRKELLDAMKQRPDAEWQEQVKRYYESLIQ